jgi:hypothetical protein
MSIPDPLRYPWYEFGVLVQECLHCDWAQRGHVLELVICPDCGRLLGPPLALEFGGLRIMYAGKGFHLRDPNGDRLTDRIGEADVPSVVQFLCKHGRDFRRRVMPRPANVQRIAPRLERFAK